MSWVQTAQAVVKAGDQGDVFDEEADESLLVQREWRSNMQRRVKGFNQGYKEGAEVIMNYGQLRGTLSALLSWCHLHDNSLTLISKINNLLDAVSQCEEYVLTQLKSVPPRPSVGDLLDSIEDMDLCRVVPAEKINEAKDERLYDSNAEFNKNCGNSPSRADCSYLEGCQTREPSYSTNASLPWILEQTASLVTQLGISVDVLQHLKQL
ncbi:protein YAE1 homolog isoform X2 [Fukomys damarensis]|uniref:protein YAE1 homolog isoform X2 n=1 Tax=Fukomys damarensis TaxID=885580 RepID=UPI00053F42B9|nr:protein YAE1 homolog isoform X2 [Fukomys damarensis]